MTQTTQCGFCRETYEVEDQTYTPEAEATFRSTSARPARGKTPAADPSATTRCSTSGPTSTFG